MEEEMRQPDAMVEVRELACGYDGKPVLHDVNFSVIRGEILFVIGRSGCGKSTLLRNMIGLESPLSGDVRFDGRGPADGSHGERRALLRRMGILFQSGALWSTLTVGENVALPLEEHTSLDLREIRELVSVKLGMVGLAGVEGAYPAELSGGMRKRAGLARALVLDPEILFFDEPSAGLDPVSARSLDRLILQTRESLGTTIVVVSHDLESICTVADRVVMLGRDEKTIIATGAPADLLRDERNPRVAEFFHGGRPAAREEMKGKTE